MGWDHRYHRSHEATVTKHSEVGRPMSLGTDAFIGPQVLTLAIPLGTLFLVCIWGFFQRRSNR